MLLKIFIKIICFLFWGLYSDYFFFGGLRTFTGYLFPIFDAHTHTHTHTHNTHTFTGAFIHAFTFQTQTYDQLDLNWFPLNLTGID